MPRRSTLHDAHPPLRGGVDRFLSRRSGLRIANHQDRQGVLALLPIGPCTLAHVAPPFVPSPDRTDPSRHCGAQDQIERLYDPGMRLRWTGKGWAEARPSHCPDCRTEWGPWQVLVGSAQCRCGSCHRAVFCRSVRSPSSRPHWATHANPRLWTVDQAVTAKPPDALPEGQGVTCSTPGA